MASYDPQSHMDLFGGLPDPGEAAIDPRDLADRWRDEAREELACADGPPSEEE